MPAEVPKLFLEKFKPLSKSKIDELPAGVSSEMKDFIESSTRVEPNLTYESAYEVKSDQALKSRSRPAETT